MKPNRGFTLLEILLAVSLMALVAAVAYGLMSGGLLARRVVNDAATRGRVMVLAMDQVARCVEAALPPTGTLAGSFIGEDSPDDAGGVLTFHAAMDSADAQWSEVALVSFYLEDDTDGERCLVRSRNRNLLAATEAEPDVQVLCRGVMDFQVQYLDGEEWVDQWDSTQHDNTLPPAVKITLTMADENADSDEDLPTLTRTVLPPCATAATTTASTGTEALP